MIPNRRVLVMRGKFGVARGLQSISRKSKQDLKMQLPLVRGLALDVELHTLPSTEMMLSLINHTASWRSCKAAGAAVSVGAHFAAEFQSRLGSFTAILTSLKASRAVGISVPT